MTSRAFTLVATVLSLTFAAVMVIAAVRGDYEILTAGGSAAFLLVFVVVMGIEFR